MRRSQVSQRRLPVEADRGLRTLLERELPTGMLPTRHPAASRHVAGLLADPADGTLHVLVRTPDAYGGHWTDRMVFPNGLTYFQMLDISPWLAAGDPLRHARELAVSIGSAGGFVAPGLIETLSVRQPDPVAA